MNILRPQDIYILLLLAAGDRNDEWTYDQLAARSGLSTSQVFRALSRAEASHLFDKESRRLRSLELGEFLTHGIRYAFAAVPGKIQRGVLTGWAAPGLGDVMVASAEEPYVWPAPDGTARGQGIEPLHSAAISAACENDALYRLLALTDVLRLGTARERKVAGEEVRRLLR